ncbi:MAG: sigma 54-interacting transcriptional regulator, partial [Pseudomonadota bacterium]
MKGAGSKNQGGRAAEAKNPSPTDRHARTRPLPVFASEDQTAGDAWQLVVAWHSDRELIGAVVELRADGGAAAPEFAIGRHEPLFTSINEETVGLANSHISRHACRLVCEDGAWTLYRRGGASRLRVDGQAVAASAAISSEQLLRGFSVALAEQVLLHVRLLPGAMSDSEGPATPETLVGTGRAMRKLRRAVHDAAERGEDVLLIGATGTGKELVARALHELGPRAGGAWVPVNVAAIPPDLAAASLFGTRRGAFTGADAHREGYFQRAAGGTLFLDEIGDASPSLQPLLLRALQEREVQVLGGPAERVELGVVAAMERDPDEPGFAFRQALRYRLAGKELRLPALAEHAEDIGLLMLLFLERRGCVPHRRSLSPGDNSRWVRLFELLLAHHWPGNVRELEHLAGEVEASLVEGAPRALGSLQQRLVPVAAASTDHRIAEETNSPDGAQTEVDGDPGRLADLDDTAFAEAWDAAGFEVAAMARRLGVSRAAVYRRIKTSPRCRLAADVPLVELLRALDSCRGDLIATAQRLKI